MLLGIDIGTSSCKITAFQPDGTVVGSVSGEYPVYFPGQGMVEQDSELWWSVICDSIKKLLSLYHVTPKDIVAIGIDGQSWSCIPIDKDGKVLANTPIWMDTRSREFCDNLSVDLKEKIFTVSGNPFSPTYTTPKMLWMKKYKPDVFDKTWKFLQSNSFIAYRLTGEISQDYSQGYGLHFFDMQKMCYDSELAQRLDLSTDLVPPLFPCDKIIGTVTEKASLLSGLSKGTPVVAGGLDAACGTLGSGVYSDNQTQEQGGQAGGMSICTTKYVSHKSLILGAHVVPGCWLLQGGTSAGGAALNWYSKVWGKGRSFKELDELAEKVPAGCEGLVFLPYLSGERTPLWNPDAKGVFFGLDFSKTEGHVIRSVLEGVAFALKHNIQVAEETGLKVSTLNSMGGAANSRLWTQIKSDVTGCEIKVPYADEATTLGAAILAGIGSGVYSGYKDAIEATVKIKRTHIPDLKQHKMYQDSFEKYMALYPALKDIYHKD